MLAKSISFSSVSALSDFGSVPGTGGAYGGVSAVRARATTRFCELHWTPSQGDAPQGTPVHLVRSL
jgi:hypothetical protein